MKLLLLITFICLIASVIANRNKTWAGIIKGMKMFMNLLPVLLLMLALVSILLFMVPNELLIHYMGKDAGMEESGWKGTGLVILLAMLQAGPLYGAFPFAYLLWKKGSSIKNIFIYLGAYSTMKIPMLTFEIGFLGLKFSLLRTLITLPVFILIGYLMEGYLKDKKFEVKQL